MKQHVSLLCRHSLGVGTERRDRDAFGLIVPDEYQTHPRSTEKAPSGQTGLSN
jgi:hypothetical protein